MLCSARQIGASRDRTVSTDGGPHTDRPSQSSRLFDPCTDTNQRQLLDPCTNGPLGCGPESHLQCSASRVRDSHLSTLQIDGVPSYRLPSATMQSTGALHGHQSASAFGSMPQTARGLGYGPESHPSALPARIRDSHLSAFQNRCRSSHRPPVAIKHSIRRLHKHQPASAFRSMHCT